MDRGLAATQRRRQLSKPGKDSSPPSMHRLASASAPSRSRLWALLRSILGSTLVILSITFPARGALNPQAFTVATAVAALVSVAVLIRRPMPITYWYLMATALGVLSLAWSMDGTATIDALIGFSIVSTTALAGGALLTARWLSAAMALAFFASAWMVNSSNDPVGAIDPVSIYNINTASKLVLLGCIALAGLVWKSSVFSKLAASLVLVAFVPTMLASGSTQAAYGWLVASAVFLLWRPVRQLASRQPALVLVISVASVIVLGYLVTGRGSWWSNTGLGDFTQSGRAAIWSALLEGCGPVDCGLGRGFGTILAQSQEVLFVPVQAHNMFLLLLLELGIAGLVLGALLLLRVLKCVAGELTPAFPAIVLTGLAWTISSDLIRFSDSFVLSTWLAITAHLTVTNQPHDEGVRQ